MVHYCSVPKCNTLAGRGESVSFHAFPRDKQLRIEWRLALRINKEVTDSMKVCGKHFKPEDYLSLAGYVYAKRKLKKCAVPSQNLPACAGKRKDLRAMDAELQSLQRALLEEKALVEELRVTVADKDQAICRLENIVLTKDNEICDLIRENDTLKRMIWENETGKRYADTVIKSEPLD